MHWLSWDKVCTHKDEGGWVLEIFKISIQPYWLNNSGVYWANQIVCSQRFSKDDIFGIPILWMNTDLTHPLMDGEVSAQLDLWLKKG